MLVHVRDAGGRHLAADPIRLFKQSDGCAVPGSFDCAGNTATARSHDDDVVGFFSLAPTRYRHGQDDNANQ
jgi:hypothetical protein